MLFFHSVVNYEVLIWGGAYKNNRILLQNLQKRILKIVFKNNSAAQDKPMNLEQMFAYESLIYHYCGLREQFQKSKSITRNKSLIIPKHTLKISNKNSFLGAITIFNMLPNELKTLKIDRVSQKTIIKNWIKINL